MFISEIATTAASGQDPVSGAIPGATTLPITAIKAYPTPAGFPGRPMLFVKVECEGGLFLLWGTLCSTNRQLARCLGPFCHTHVPWSRYGWGESGLSGREYAVKGAVEHYTEFLLGRDAMRIGALWQEMCNYTSLRIPRISIETAAFSVPLSIAKAAISIEIRSKPVPQSLCCIISAVRRPSILFDEERPTVLKA